MDQQVFITRRIPGEACEELRRAGLTFAMNETDDVLSPDALRAAAIGRSGLVCLVGDRIDAALIERLGPTCKVIATVSVGYDHVDVATARRLGIVVTNTPDVLTETTADLAWALLMAAARRLGEAERIVRSGRWRGFGFNDLLGADVHGATLGVVGAGRIGLAVARRASGFSMRVLVCGRRAKPDDVPGTTRVDLDTLLRQSDFVSLNVPLTADTRGMMGAAQFERMKRTAILVNTSRGSVVNQSALIRALQDGTIAGAGLDVFENEPNVPSELVAMENVVLLPHIGSASRATRLKMASMATAGIVAVLRGQTPHYAV